jgi:hypothetical protein
MSRPIFCAVRRTSSSIPWCAVAATCSHHSKTECTAHRYASPRPTPRYQCGRSQGVPASVPPLQPLPFGRPDPQQTQRSKSPGPIDSVDQSTLRQLTHGRYTARPVVKFGIEPLRSKYQTVPIILQNTAHYSKMYPKYYHSLAYRSDTAYVCGIRRVLQYQWPVS